MTNTQVLVDRLPQGKLRADDYRVVESDAPQPEDGQVLVETTAVAITAGTRAGLQGSASYAGAPKTGVVMNATGVGRVVASRSDAVAEGAAVMAATGWQQLSVHDARAVSVIPGDHDPIHYLGPLGINGLTAYFGLLDVGQARAGQCVLVSAAAGSVGHLVGQIAKLRGARAVGVCGSNEKAARLTAELGFDAAVSYRDDDFRAALKAATPDRVDVYFDNTGGPVLEAALRRMNSGGRIACCGVVSQYDTDTPAPGRPVYPDCS